MKAAFHTLYWEVFRKNRIVLAALFALLSTGGALALASVHATPDAWWLGKATGFAIVAFLASLLLAFGLFSLTESSAGWRMNSMLTRWFVLPVRTGFLVGIPLLTAAAFMALLVAVWMPILDRLAPGLDAVYMAAVLVLGITAVHALAWTVPRKPGQFWVGAAILFPVILLLALLPQDQPGREPFRRGALIPFSYATLGLIVFAWFAARRNRCGDWPGELPLDRVWQFLRQGGVTTSRRKDFRSSTTALLWSDSLPSLRLLAFSWLGLVLVLFLYFSFGSRRSFPELAFSLRLLSFIALNILPVATLLWLAIWGVFAGCEPSTGFRTRLSAFRAMLPVSSGTLATQKIVTLLLGWCVVWLPSLALGLWYDPAVNGVESPEMTAQLPVLIARWMALGACVLVGALPFFLLGRIDGFPNLLLVGMCTWAGTWVVAGNLSAEGDPGWRGALAWVLFGLKFAVAGLGFLLAARAGHVTWRFPVFLLIGWAGIAAFLVWGMSTWQVAGPQAALTLVLFLPLARLAWCPLALAANRHR